MHRPKIVKNTRTLIRLKHSLKADEVIHAILPATQEEFEAAIARGELRELKAELNDIANT
jgi:hypothetical protein